MRILGWLLVTIGLVGVARGQGVAPGPAAALVDPVVVAAQDYVGRALILRGFPAGGELEYDAAGRLQSPGKVVDWTLAGMEVDTVKRRAVGEVELDGLRVAVRYNPDNHLFQRHALKDERVRVVFPAPVDARGVARVMDAVFSTGIDPALQRAMPPYWKHYFLPGEPWDDGLGALVPATGAMPAGSTAPVVEKKVEPEYTAEARADRVKGLVSARLVVDGDGSVKRVAIRQPLGYGLDARTVEAILRFRFRPGTVAGKPVAMEMVVNQSFDVAP